MTNAELIMALRQRSEAKESELTFAWLYETQGAMSQAADLIEAQAKRIAELEEQMPKEGEWIMDEHPHDGDCRCSVCLIAIDAMHERNHGLLNALTGGKWWRFYRYCPNCGSRMAKGEQE